MWNLCVIYYYIAQTQHEDDDSDDNNDDINDFVVMYTLKHKSYTLTRAKRDKM